MRLHPRRDGGSGFLSPNGEMSPTSPYRTFAKPLHLSQRYACSTLFLDIQTNPREQIVDFVIWLLFSREKNSSTWPKHILCDGFRRTTTEKDSNGGTIPGIFSRFPNDSVSALRATPWPQILALLGQSGEKAMLDLLLDCSIFVAVDAGFGNYYQLSGK
jgi:hypothetical protein